MPESRSASVDVLPVRVEPSGEALEARKKFFELLPTADDAQELGEAVREQVRSRHAESTRENYAYWLGRLGRWMSDPSSRFRLKELPGVPLEALWPIDAQSEALILAWLTDISLGPKDPDELEEWLDVAGPVAPGTLGNIISAIKARSTESQEVPWTPSTTAQNALSGLRRRLRDAYGPSTQAEPLLGLPHVAPIAKMLVDREAPQAALTRVLLELHAAGVDGGGSLAVRRCDILQPARGVEVIDAATNEELFAQTGTVALPSLRIPGRRRGRKTERDQVVTLTEHPKLAAALEAYLERRPATNDDRLVVLSAANRSAHIREVLRRLAERSGVEWRPGRNSWASKREVQMMRAALDRGVGWTGQVRRQRDHVMLLVGYLCALRRSELCSLRIRDVLINDTTAVVSIIKSKTDQNMQGVKLPIHRAQGSPWYLDAVVSLGRWVATLRDEYGAAPDDPLFPALQRRGTPVRRNGKLLALDPQAWSDRLRELARETQVFGDDATGRYDRVSGHSLRRGFVTTALLAGQDPITVAKQTRHKNVQMLVLYADELRILEGTSWAEVHFGETLGLPGQDGPTRAA